MKPSYKNKISLLRGAIAILTVVAFLMFPSQKVKAWDAIQGALYRTALDNLWKTLDGITLAAAKQAALQIIAEEIDKFVDDMIGIGGGLITNWEDFLVNLPEQKSKQFMNDYLSGITEGRDSSRYRGVPVSRTLSYYRNEYEGFGAKNEFEFALIQSARAEEATSTEEEDGAGSRYEDTLKNIGISVMEENDAQPEKPTCTPDMRSNMFSGGNLNNFWECTSGMNYAPIARSRLTSIYQRQLNKELRQAEIEAQSSGFSSKKDKNGQVVTPAASLEATVTKAQTATLDILTQARSLPEVVAASVVAAINRSIQQGIGAVKAAAQRQIANVRKQVTNSIKQQARQIGPQAVFKNR